MTRRRWLLASGLLLALVLAGLLLLWLNAPAHRIDPHGFAQIVDGMTEQDVEACLGVPAGDYFSRPTYRGGVFPIAPPTDPDGKVKEWAGDRATIQVWFDASGRVTDTFFIPTITVPEPFTDKLRRWLGLAT